MIELMTAPWDPLLTALLTITYTAFALGSAVWAVLRVAAELKPGRYPWDWLREDTEPI